MMDLSVEEKGSVQLIVMKGSLDANTSKDARETFNALLNQGNQEFVVDLSEVEFIDSSGLGALVGFFKKVRIGEGDVKLAGMRDSIHKIFELTRLDKVFPIFNSVESAMN